MNLSTLEAALEYHRLGISVFPLKPGSKDPVRGFRLKRYLHGEKRANEDALRDWFDRTDFGIGIICGRVSGNLIVRDFDKSGSHQRWRDHNPELSKRLPAVATGRIGGVHIYARCADTRHHDLSDGELRGDLHYVAAPPTIHPESNEPYRWLRPLSAGIPVIDDPFTLIGGGRRKGTPEGPVTHINCVPRPYVPLSQADVADAINATLPRQFGQRNTCLLALCRALRSLYPSATPDEMLPHLQEWHRLALPNIRDKEFRQTWRQFKSAFPKTKVTQVNVCHDGPTWAQAVSIAAEMTSPRDSQEVRLFNLCLALHQSWGCAPFPLGCRKAAEYLGVGYKTASRLLQVLVIRGVLKLVKSYPEAERKANEYSVIGGTR
jgi:hypothetical protein